MALSGVVMIYTAVQEIVPIVMIKELAVATRASHRIKLLKRLRTLKVTGLLCRVYGVGTNISLVVIFHALING